MSDDKPKQYSGHRPPDATKIVQSHVGKSGHQSPSGDGAITGSGHPVRVDPQNVAPVSPPPKRDDAGSSAKPPENRR